jgi:hypothetical protein
VRDARGRLPGQGVYYEIEPSPIPPGAILTRPAMICVNCQKNDEEVTLVKCPICFKMVCHECGRKEYGRVFCSQRCAHLFFFGDDDE